MKIHSVIPERAGDGTLYEVADLSGRIVSAHPCARRAAVALAEHLDCDAENEGKQLARSLRSVRHGSARCRVLELC